MAVTQGVDVRAVLIDPCPHLIGAAHGAVTGDDDVDLVRNGLEQPQSGEVVAGRIRGIQVEERDQDIGEHVAGDEHAAFLDQQRGMPRGVGLMLDDPDRGAVPGQVRRTGGQTGDEAEEVERDLRCVFRRQGFGNTVLPVRGRQEILDVSRAAGRSVPGASPNSACQRT
jgi:hypothetical protein